METKELAWRIRKHSIEMVNIAHASHIGGILSCTDVVAVLYNEVAKYDRENPEWPDRDRIILSKGHNGVAIYAALAEMGFFPVDLLKTYGQNGGMFSCHISHKKVPGVELTTGSLGHGISVAAGMALNGKLKNKNYRVFTIVGDGECNEGSVWETAMFASHNKLDNFVVIVDANGMQAMGNCRDILDLEPMAEKWKAFGWSVQEIDGHDYKQIKEALNYREIDKPTVVIARTTKGKGVSYMENELLWHYRDPQGEDFEIAMKELEEAHNA